MAEALPDQGFAPFCFQQASWLGGTLKIISLIELGQVDEIDLIINLIIRNSIVIGADLVIGNAYVIVYLGLDENCYTAILAVEVEKEID